MSLAIGEVARQTGTTVSAVRYYDRQGLIAATHRAGDKRRFDDATVGRINFIRRAKQLRFSLDEIKAILDEGETDWQSLVEAKRNELVQQRRDLDLMIAMLDEIAACGCEVVAECPVALG